MADFIAKVTALTGVPVLSSEYRDFTHYIHVDKKYIRPISCKSQEIQDKLEVKDLWFTIGMGFQDKEGVVYQFVPK